MRGEPRDGDEVRLGQLESARSFMRCLRRRLVGVPQRERTAGDRGERGMNQLASRARFHARERRVENLPAPLDQDAKRLPDRFAKMCRAFLVERDLHIARIGASELRDLVARSQKRSQHLLELAAGNPAGERRVNFQGREIVFAIGDGRAQRLGFGVLGLEERELAAGVSDARLQLLLREIELAPLEVGDGVIIAQLDEQRAGLDGVAVVNVDRLHEAGTLRAEHGGVGEFHHGRAGDRAAKRDEEQSANEQRSEREPPGNREAALERGSFRLRRGLDHLPERHAEPERAGDGGEKNSAAAQRHTRGHEQARENHDLPKRGGDAVRRDDPILARAQGQLTRRALAEQEPRDHVARPAAAARAEIRNAEQVPEDVVAVEAHQRVRVEQQGHDGAGENEVVRDRRAEAVGGARPIDRGDRGNEKFRVEARARDHDAAPLRGEAEARGGIDVAHGNEEHEDHAELADGRAEVLAKKSVR